MKPLAWALTACLFLLTHGVANAVPGDGIYAKPGRLVSTSDGARLNFYCMGSGSPVIIFDAAESDWSPAWANVLPRVAKWTRACSYDRAGLGFSGPGPMPRTAERFAEELHDALHNASIHEPYVLVGHATGAYSVRAFADKFLSEVAGVVLIEGDARDVETSADLAEIWRGIGARNLAELQMCRDRVVRGEPMPMPPPPDHPAWTCHDYFYRGLPEEKFSPQLNATLLSIVATKVAMYDTLISGVEQRSSDDTYLREHRISLGSRPLRIIVADHHISDSPSTPLARHLEHVKFNAERKLFQERLLDLSSNARLILTQTGPYVQFDRPDIVIGAIREVYDQSKRSAVDLRVGTSSSFGPAGYAKWLCFAANYQSLTMTSSLGKLTI
jgi:pimeloyl-ACP methyl ester carboxylesterase